MSGGEGKGNKGCARAFWDGLGYKKVVNKGFISHKEEIWILKKQMFLVA